MTKKELIAQVNQLEIDNESLHEIVDQWKDLAIARRLEIAQLEDKIKTKDDGYRDVNHPLTVVLH